MKSTHLLAIGEGILVTIIWASSFVFIKMGLFYLKPLTLAGVRYSIAFLLLLPLMIQHGELKDNTAKVNLIPLLLMGLCAYTIGNGTLFWGLKYLPATSGSFLHSLVPFPVLFLGIFWLKEIPRRWQIIGLLVTLIGSALFFSSGLSAKEPHAVGVVSIGVLAFAIFGILGRKLSMQGRIGIIPMTAIPLGFGGGLLLLLGLLIEGMFSIPLAGLLIILWLVVVNTIIAYLLFYHSLRVLTALELHVLLNLSPLGTALLASILLDERLTLNQIIGMIIVVMGVSLVQWRKENITEKRIS